MSLGFAPRAVPPSDPPDFHKETKEGWELLPLLFQLCDDGRIFEVARVNLVSIAYRRFKLQLQLVGHRKVIR
jgi:hypothetical protein